MRPSRLSDAEDQSESDGSNSLNDSHGQEERKLPYPTSLATSLDVADVSSDSDNNSSSTRTKRLYPTQGDLKQSIPRKKIKVESVADFIRGKLKNPSKKAKKRSHHVSPIQASTEATKKYQKKYHRHGVSVHHISAKGPLPTCATCNQKLQRGEKGVVNKYITNEQKGYSRISYYHFSDSCLDWMSVLGRNKITGGVRE